MANRIRQRDYQVEAKREAFAAWDRGERAHLMAAPTGSGKTLVETKVAEEWVRHSGGAVLVLASDSRELVRQLSASFRRHTRLSVGVEMGPERVRRDALPTIVCATVQTMVRRLKDFKRDAFSLLIQDEADHAAAPTWRKIKDHFWSARIFGCTATPNRHDGRRVPFDSAHKAATHQQLIDGGMISPIEVRDVRVVDRSLIVLPSGEKPDPEAIARIWKEEGDLHSIVEPSLRLAENRPTIVFAPTIERARELAAMFNRYRPSCSRAVWGVMPSVERAETMAAFRDRRFQFIVNVSVLGRGIDLPFVSCVVMARVTQSRTVYEQAIGRGWRADRGKDKLLVLDFCENAQRHRLVSTVALLAGRGNDQEIVERAIERLEENNGGDITEALDAAKIDLLDAGVRARVRARVAVRTRTVDLLVEKISENDWLTKNNRQIGREFHLDHNVVRTRRPANLPSPSSHPNRKMPIDWDAQPLGKEPDKDIANRLGRSTSTVTEARTRRGIDKFRPVSVAVPGSRQNARSVRDQPPQKCYYRKCGVEFSVLRLFTKRDKRFFCCKKHKWSEQALEQMPKRLARKRDYYRRDHPVAQDRTEIKEWEHLCHECVNGDPSHCPSRMRAREQSLSHWNAMSPEQQEEIREYGRRAGKLK
jgi:superfamily II DNA or RNA helicase